MLKNLSQLEVVIENKVFRFVCEIDAPLEHVKESLFQFQKYVGQVEDSVKLQNQQAEQAQAKVAEQEAVQPE